MDKHSFPKYKLSLYTHTHTQGFINRHHDERLIKIRKYTRYFGCVASFLPKKKRGLLTIILSGQ